MAQNPSSKPLTDLLRKEAAVKTAAGDLSTANLLNASADTIEHSDENARKAITETTNTRIENASLQREAGWADGIGDIGKWIIYIIIGSILILLLIVYLRSGTGSPILNSLKIPI